MGAILREKATIDDFIEFDLKLIREVAKARRELERERSEKDRVTAEEKGEERSGRKASRGGFR